MKTLIEACPCCGSYHVQTFHTVRDVPVNSVLTLDSRDEALSFPTGDIELGFCPDCGFVYNRAFDAEKLEYSERYDPTQSFSGTFNAWHRQLAEDVVERFGLRGKRVIEIGCGKGEFLHLLAEVGDVSGVGFDPSYEADRDAANGHDKLEFVADFYSEKYADVKGDAVCCKMTLEHISPASRFMQTVRRAVGDDEDTVILFQVPDVRRILEEAAFWDIYYEHCSYYSAGSLARLFRRCGFDVVGVRREYDDQYLMLEARPSGGTHREALDEEDDLARLRGLVDGFRGRLDALATTWTERLESYRAAGKKVVIWGSGSKGVAFLTTFGGGGGIEYVVDINPHRQGHFMLRTGQEIVSPEFLESYRPDVVVVMNPVYREEIERDLARMGLSPEVLTT
ncbi:MAG: class I SAM-dependent methyltransferase [Planctomycetota bacterium]